jgi:acylglycerol lipase
MQPDEPPKAKVILIHGFSDHVNLYNVFCDGLAQRGIAVYGIDQRGWGRTVKSTSDRGRTGPTTTVLADMAAFIRDKLPSDVPVFLLGHSMGGGQTIALASTPEYEDLVSQIRGIILEAPFLGFGPSLKPHWFTVFSGKLASHILPNFKMVRPVPPEDLSRIPEIQKQYAEDPLTHDTGTLEGLAGLLDRTERIGNGSLKLNPKVKSLLLAHGTSDRAADYGSAKSWYDRQKIEDGEFKTYDGMYHVLHSDIGGEEFIKYVGDWILSRCDTGGSAAKHKL